MPLKRTSIKNTLILFVCCILIYGCKKQSDYRDKFIGNYYFTVHRTDWTWPGNTTDTIYYYNGKVEYGTKTNTVLIIFSEKSVVPYYSFEPIIYEEGSFQNSSGYGGSIAGEFESITKVKFHIGNYAQGYKNNYDITGEKE